MKFNIYNFYNEPTEIDSGDKEICYITVELITGDEWIYIKYEDGTMGRYGSDVKLVTFCFSSYIVPKERIREWIDLEKTAQGTVSYYRLEKFKEKEEE